MTQAETPAPLSMSAEWLVGVVCSETSGEDVGVVLGKADAGAFAEASRVSGVDWGAVPGARLPVGREDVARRAGVRAASEGRPVAAVVDVVWAVVGLVAETATERSARPTKTAKATKTAASRKPSPSKARRVAPVSRVDARVVRVFVSSTFRDMQEERDELVKHTFPQLRKLCESRGVTWGEVDLRWGITDEAKAEGQVLPTCLAEIRGCRPFFIGMLGERYGWVLDEIEPAALEDEPWVAEQVGRSVTELEILQGVLNDPDMAEHAFFYLRDPAYVEGKPADTFREVPTAEEVTEFGQVEAHRRAADRFEKLQGLKERLRTSNLPVREDYQDPRTLGALVLADLTEVIDRLYPAGSEPDPLTRERTEHEAFAKSRAGVYIGRKAYVDTLGAHAKGHGLPLVVLGESGSGKSALLANWALGYRAAHPDVFVLPHFIGASPTSTDWSGMVRRIIAELSANFDLTIEVPDEASALRVTFATTLHMAAAKGRIILVIDAVNQLEDREGALDLTWVPPSLPDGVRLVVSTLPGRPLDEATKRRWATLKVEPLQSTERTSLITEYLASHSRALSTALVERIATAPQAANPLYLRALLDELRVWGDHDTLPARIDHYLKATTVDVLYELILARYESDYDRDRPGLVQDAFTLLWAARRGLAEAELLDLLGSDGTPLPRAHWSPLFLATESSLTNRSGLLTFFHDYLRTAVHHRYLPMDDTQHAAHLLLADYFTPRDITPRTIDELPWQLAQASAWDALANLLGDLNFLTAAWAKEKFEVQARWAQVESNSTYRRLTIYRIVLAHPANHDPGTVEVVGHLLGDSGHIAEALALREHLLARYRESGDQVRLANALGSVALLLDFRGERDAAMALHEEQARLCRSLGDLDGLQAALGHQGAILYARGETKRGMALLKEQERLCRETGNRDGLERSLGNQAAILHMEEDSEGALALLEQRERICRDIGSLDSLGVTLGNRAVILARQGDVEGSWALLQEGEALGRALGDVYGVANNLRNQALLLDRLGRTAEARPVAKEALRLADEGGFLELADFLRRNCGGLLT